MKAIETFELTKYYGKTRGIENVSLSVEEGEFFGFIGPNGAGKSTLIRTLLGLISPSSGRAEIYGKDIITSKIENLRGIGYLPSETSFWKGMTVGEVLKFFAKMRGLDCSDEARVLCERLALITDRRIEELSLGNKKKVGIVCALQHKPSLYILDEPTSGLDPLMQQEFFNILKERNNDGATVFLSSHNLSEIKKYCGKAAIIRNGGILLSDNVDNLAHTGVKKVSVSVAGEIPEIEGMSSIKRDGERVSFLYSGAAGKLITLLSTIDLTDVNISDPELDEIFMNYYAKEEQ